jgi:hypothetical protein
MPATGVTAVWRGVMAKDEIGPWNRSPKAHKPRKHLSPSQKRAAKGDAARAGRPYPNLVDNMRAARKSSTHRSRPAR